MEVLWTVQEVAKYLQWNPQTVYRKAKAGELPGKKVGKNSWRFRKNDIDQWLSGDRPEVKAEGK